MRAIRQAGRVIQDALDSDPENTMYLLRTPYPTSEAILEHPTIQCGRGGEDGTTPDPGIKQGQPWTSVLGLINGLFGIDDQGRGYIAIQLYDRPLVAILSGDEYVLLDDLA